jgi:diguanylate cyclase (GGDEF)-like protein
MNQMADESRLWALIQGLRFDVRYQPIVDLKTQRVMGHEALMAPRSDSGFTGPLDAFTQARALALHAELDLACVRRILQDFIDRRLKTRLFLNINSATLADESSLAALIDQLEAAERHLGRHRLVVELTEVDSLNHSGVTVFSHACRRAGAAIALDDFGVGHSNLDAWLQYTPEKVKIDRYFIAGLEHDAARQQLLRGLQQMAELTGTRLLAEGIETREQLLVVKELGIELGQGYFLGRPHGTPAFDLAPATGAALAEHKPVVLAQGGRRQSRHGALKPLVDPCEALPAEATIKAVMAFFLAHPGQAALALVDGRHQPVAIIARATFMDRMAHPYRMEVLGARPALKFANEAPVALDVDAGFDELTAVLTLADQRYLTDGVVVTHEGLYQGICSAHQLVRLVTESRIEAARHANPLTLLPGNYPITQHLERMLAGGTPFVLAYADLNHFKPFNDRYGFWKGDDIILKAAASIRTHLDLLHDFVGHVGGDDFVLVMQSPDWLERLGAMALAANSAIAAMYPQADRAAGGIEAEDRFGVKRFFPLVTLSFGVVEIDSGHGMDLAALTSAVADAKKQSKERGQSIAVGRSPCPVPTSPALALET